MFSEIGLQQETDLRSSGTVVVSVCALWETSWSLSCGSPQIYTCCKERGLCISLKVFYSFLSAFFAFLDPYNNPLRQHKCSYPILQLRTKRLRGGRNLPLIHTVGETREDLVYGILLNIFPLQNMGLQRKKLLCKNFLSHSL